MGHNVPGSRQAEFQSRRTVFFVIQLQSCRLRWRGNPELGMVQDSTKGRLIAANRDGGYFVLRRICGGTSYRYPDSNTLRLAGHQCEDRIYVGAVGQFGYLQADSVGLAVP